MNDSQIGNSELISTVNSRLVLQAVRMMQPTFRAAVARQTGLKPATVTSIVNGLISSQMLQETPASAVEVSRFGRPPLMLRVNGDIKRILAIDLEPDRLRVAVTNILLEVLEYQEAPIDRFSKPAVVFREIDRLCEQVLNGLHRRQLQGVGVSLPGLIDRERGVLLSSTNMPNWRDVPVADLLEKSLHCPVRVERSIRLAALYEKWSDPNHQDRTVLMVSLRTGIGISLMHQGELYSGNLGCDGEIGHTTVDIDGPLCDCGNRGCLETFVGAPAICARAQAALDIGGAIRLGRALEAGEKLSSELIYRLARDGDPDCCEMVRVVGRYLGIAVANMINLLSPHEIVICGSIDVAGEILLETLKRQIDESALPRARRGVTIRLARQQDKLPLLGAAVLVAQDLFQLPRLRHGAFGAPRPIQFFATVPSPLEVG